MRTTFQQRLDGLEAKLGQMGQVLRSQLDRTLIALATADEDVADEVIRRDQLLDADYVEVEEEILRTLALEAPVATNRTPRSSRPWPRWASTPGGCSTPPWNASPTATSSWPSGCRSWTSRSTS